MNDFSKKNFRFLNLNLSEEKNCFCFDKRRHFKKKSLCSIKEIIWIIFKKSLF